MGSKYASELWIDFTHFSGVSIVDFEQVTWVTGLLEQIFQKLILKKNSNILMLKVSEIQKILTSLFNNDFLN